MEKSVVSLDTPVRLNGITVIPVVKVSISYSFAAGISIVSIKRPLAVVLKAISGIKYYKITGEEVSREKLIEEFPSIIKALEESE
jgi:uncharacterized spore protein YtfJ